MDKFPLLAIPCFILAGSLMERGGVTRQIISVVSQFTGRVRGGLGIATILACMFFSAISGSGPGTVAAVGSVMIPAMLRAGHGRDYAGAVSSSGGTLGILIPPSNPMIIYGVIAQTSIVGLFMAGIVPGMIIGVAHCLVAYLVARHVGYEATGERFNLRELARACWRGKFALAAPFLILGGIYAGVFTPVEASVIAVLYGLLVGGVVNRMLDFKAIFDSLIEAARISTAMIIVATSTVFGQILTLNQAPRSSRGSLRPSRAIRSRSSSSSSSRSHPRMFMETLSTIIIVTPVLLPVIVQLGIDPIHFGILFVVTNEVAFLTPPLGANLFVASQLANVSLERLSLHVLPHIAAIVLCILVLAYFPEISLWLPHLLGYGCSSLIPTISRRGTRSGGPGPHGRTRPVARRLRVAPCGG